MKHYIVRGPVFYLDERTKQTTLIPEGTRIEVVMLDGGSNMALRWKDRAVAAKCVIPAALWSAFVAKHVEEV